MANVTIRLKDGTVKKFKHRGRPGGRYTVRVKYEGAFIIITDEYDVQTAIPAADILEAVTEPNGHGW